MQRVDFYILSEKAKQNYFLFACRLIEKAYQSQHSMYVHTANEADAKMFDDLLWTFHDISFIPHHRKGAPTSTSIEIGHENQPKFAPNTYEILLNLTPTLPDFFKHFNRVLEIVPPTPEARIQSREKYRLYREQGCELQTHQIG